MVLRASKAVQRRALALCAAAALGLVGCAAGPPQVDAATLADEVAPEHRAARDLLVRFERASNAHDLAALAQLFAVDAIWYLEEIPIYRGRDEVLGPLEYDAATHAQLALQNLRFRDQAEPGATEVLCEIVESNDFFEALGVDSIRQQVQFTLVDDRIASVRSLRADGPAGEGERRVAHFLTWLGRERPADFERLMGTGARPELAGELVALARQWTAAGQPD